LETRHKATHGDDIAKLCWLHPYLGDKQLDEIDRTLIDRIKFDREKIAAAGTTNRYLALIRALALIKTDPSLLTKTDPANWGWWRAKAAGRRWIGLH
jgi:hypothetical protein